jgi:hypothetical protein
MQLCEMQRQMKVLIILLSFLAVSCHNQRPLKGKIFERKEFDGNRLMIKYRYTTSGKENIDSVIIKNQKINSDSIDLILQPNNPGKVVPNISQ